MAHPQSAEAGDVPVTTDSAAAAFSDMLDAEDGIESETQGEGEGGDEDVPLELDTEGEESGESEPTSAIAPPVSLNAEEKNRFAQLPEEAQRFVTELETRRNEQVQQVTTKASNAQREAEARAAAADAQAKKVYAQQLMTVVSGMRPSPPDPQIAATDPGQYIHLKAQYDADAAQFDQFVQQVQTLDGEATQQIDQTFIEQRDRELLTVPEVRDEGTRAQFFEKAIDAAKSLGLQADALNGATAAEWQSLRQIHDWKTDAEKYRAAMSRQMQRVREGKNKAKTMKPGAAQPIGSAKATALVQQFEAAPSRDTAAALAAAYLG